MPQNPKVPPFPNVGTAKQKEWKMLIAPCSLTLGLMTQAVCHWVEYSLGENECCMAYFLIKDNLILRKCILPAHAIK